LKLTTDKHKASRGLSATAELIVTRPRLVELSLCDRSFCRPVSRITHDRGDGRRPNMV